MTNQKIKKQSTVSKNKQFNKSSAGQLKQKSNDYFKFFIPFIIVITAVVFANTLGNDFADNWDDNIYILDNNIIRYLNWKNFKEIFSSFYNGCYQPITMLSYTIEYKFFGYNPFPYHFTNYILHILNAVLVYLFIKRFTGRLWVAAITSLFFAVHPMHVESVAWVTERKDVLYTFFFLLSLISYSKHLKTKNKFSYISSLFWLLLSLMSKSAAVCLPLVLVLMDYYHHKKISWKELISKIPFFLLALFFGVLAVISQKSAGAISDLTPLYSIIERIFLVSYSAIYYIFKVFAPFNLSTIHFYPVKSGSMFPIGYYLALPAIILLIWGILKSGNFKHELIFGLLFYLITIVMVLQIIPAGQAIVSERYSYVPYIGVFFIFGQFYYYIKENKFSFGRKIKSIVSVIFVILAISYSFLSYERNKVWKNGIILFTDVIKKYPDQGFAWCVRGNGKNNIKDFEAALSDFNKGIMLGYDNQASIFMSRGFAKDNLGDNAGALSDYNTTIKIKPDYPDVYYNRGNVYSKFNEFDSALADFNIAIKLKPDYPQALNNRGLTFESLDRVEEALADFNKAIELNPQYSEAYFNRAGAYDKIGKFESAINDYTKGIEINPDPMAYYCRGFSKVRINDFSGAITDYNKALEKKPNVPDIYMKRAFAKFNLNDKAGACDDWLSAQKYGHAQAAAALEKYCK